MRSIRSVLLRGIAASALGIAVGVAVVFVLDRVLALFGCESCVGQVGSFAIGFVIGLFGTMTTIVLLLPWIEGDTA